MQVPRLGGYLSRDVGGDDGEFDGVTLVTKISTWCSHRKKVVLEVLAMVVVVVEVSTMIVSECTLLL